MDPSSLIRLEREWLTERIIARWGSQTTQVDKDFANHAKQILDKIESVQGQGPVHVDPSRGDELYRLAVRLQGLRQREKDQGRIAVLERLKGQMVPYMMRPDSEH